MQPLIFNPTSDIWTTFCATRNFNEWHMLIVKEEIDYLIYSKDYHVWEEKSDNDI